MIERSKELLWFPIDTICIFFMILSFGNDATKRMIKSEKTFLQGEIKKEKDNDTNRN